MHREQITPEGGQVLSFRPRSRVGGRAFTHAPAPFPVEDIGKYERSAGEADDYRHRMVVNAAAFAFLLLLIGTGIWLAVKIADLRRDQDCVLSGRRNCAQLSIVGNSR